MSFNVNTVNGTLGNTAAQMDAQLSQLSSTMDASNPQDLMKFQAAMNQFQQVIGLQSAAIKAIGDVARGIIQKIG
ncbi:MAG: EscF/YscF/HrpA family type III secretion system needle major subunit [Gammaproteobacteria bacterium]